MEGTIPTSEGERAELSLWGKKRGQGRKGSVSVDEGEMSGLWLRVKVSEYDYG